MPKFVFKLRRSVVHVGFLGDGKSEINLQGDESNEEGEEDFNQEDPHSHAQHLTEDSVGSKDGLKLNQYKYKQQC